MSLENIKIGESHFITCEDMDQWKTLEKVQIDIFIKIKNENITLKAVEAEGGIIVFRVNPYFKIVRIKLRHAAREEQNRIEKKKNRDIEKKKKKEAVLLRKKQRLRKKVAATMMIEEAAEERKIKREAREKATEELQKGVEERKQARLDRTAKTLADRELKKKEEKERSDRFTRESQKRIDDFKRQNKGRF